MKRTIIRIALGFISIGALQAQEVAESAVRQYAFSLQTGHYYDLKFSSFDDLLNGASGEDMRGLNGLNSKFDVGFAGRFHYYYSPILSFELGYDRATVTGANTVEWHTSKNEAYTIAMKMNLKKSSDANDYATVPFMRLGYGMLNYDAERSFVSDGILFSNTSGATTVSDIGFGIQHHISDAISVNLQSSLRIVNTDAWDGYDYSSGKDHLLMTTVGAEYALGKGRHMNRLPSYRDVRVNKLMLELETLKSNDESMMQMIQLNTKENSQLKADMELIKEGMDKLAEAQEGLTSQLNGVMNGYGTYRIYYRFNNAVIEEAFQIELQKRVFALEGEDYMIELQAFSDPKGTKVANAFIRQMRINKAKDLLNSWGISDDKITVKKWSGEYTGTDDMDRRLEVTITKN